MNRFFLGITLAIALITVGCGTPTSKHVRWYEGPPLPTNQVVLLKAPRTFSHPIPVVWKIDGVSLLEAQKADYNRTTSIELKPGRHSVDVGYVQGTTRSLVDAHLTFDGTAGATYEIRVAPIDEGLGKVLRLGFVGGISYWTAWIVDLSNEDVVAGTPRHEPLRWYE